jgi:putative DNA methylase
MEVFCRYSKVVEADGTAMTVGAALALINQVLDEVTAEQEGEYDAATRWAVAWFSQNGTARGPFGQAEVLSKAKNTAVDAMVKAGIVQSGAGKVRLLARTELPQQWNPSVRDRLTIWEATQRLVLAHDSGGEAAAGALVARLGGDISDRCRDLARRLFSICDRRGWAQEAIPYNALVSAWPQVLAVAQTAQGAQQGRFA